MAAYRRVYDSRHLQADCQEPGSVPEPYARHSGMGYLYLLPYCSNVLVVEGGVRVARRRAAARKMKQLKNASKDIDDLDNEDDLDDVYSDFNGNASALSALSAYRPIVTIRGGFRSKYLRGHGSFPSVSSSLPSPPLRLFPLFIPSLFTFPLPLSLEVGSLKYS